MKNASATTPPLKPVEFLILLMLVDAPCHGYGIMLSVDAATDGAVRLDAGNLYRSLRKFQREGFVAKIERRAAPESDDERRQYYALTPRGRQAATDEARRIEGLLRLEPAHRLLHGEPPS